MIPCSRTFWARSAAAAGIALWTLSPPVWAEAPLVGPCAPTTVPDPQNPGSTIAVEGPCTLEHLRIGAVRIFEYLLFVGGAAAVLAVVVAGFNFFIAVFVGAEPGRVQQAKTMLAYALVGTALLLLPYVLICFIYAALLGGDASLCPNLPGLGSPPQPTN